MHAALHTIFAVATTLATGATAISNPPGARPKFGGRSVADLLLLRRATQEDLCQPPVEDSDSVIPPCTSVETIETICLPNGTSTLALVAHAQCMCGGSFFADWLGCRACLAAHGFLPERDEQKFASALATVSAEMCGDGATPTAEFNVLFESAAAAQPAPTDGSTETGVDKLDGSTAVSLYYTAPDSQGPGAITGSATSATATGDRPTATSGGDGGDDEENTTKSLTTLTGTNDATDTADGAEETGSGDDENAGLRVGAPLLGAGLAAVIAAF